MDQQQNKIYCLHDVVSINMSNYIEVNAKFNDDVIFFSPFRIDLKQYSFSDFKCWGWFKTVTDY